MRVLANTMTPRIIDLYRDGLAVADIAALVGRSRSNVHKTLKRHEIEGYGERRAHTQISPLPRDLLQWLREEAGRLNVSTRDLARALLVDAIYEARNGNG